MVMGENKGGNRITGGLQGKETGATDGERNAQQIPINHFSCNYFILWEYQMGKN